MRANRAVGVIAVAQLFGTSLWFSANAAMHDLQTSWHLTASGMGWLTNSVQVGFIVGTLLSALTGIADRLPTSRVFAACGLLGALLNALFALCSSGFASAVVFRFGVGIALAGIYPLGMKLLVTWAPTRAAQTLAWLVAMLTLGTASVHAIRGMLDTLSWHLVVLTSSLLAVAGALMVLSLGEGPYTRRGVTKALTGGVGSVFRIREFRAAAFGYFGHMWELYAFWTLVPLLVTRAVANSPMESTRDVALLSFSIIGIGAVGCVAGGMFSKRFGSARAAFIALLVSGSLCLIYPVVASKAQPVVQLTLLLVWGLAVIADSPQFSALTVRASPPELIGGALTLQNSFGFFLSACSIFAATSAYHSLGTWISLILLPGPVLGLLAMSPLLAKKPRW
ncbi:MFS transporter [Burkholderia multivorans R-20526]|nr:MFS transporter [Burkholderia multivorans R-20526]